jgi:hypothetical protein
MTSSMGGSMTSSTNRAASETAAAEHGVADLGSYVLRGLAAGRSLSALSTAAGLPRRWLNDHLDQVIDSATWRDRLVGSMGEPRPALRLVRSAEETG